VDLFPLRELPERWREDAEREVRCGLPGDRVPRAAAFSPSLVISPISRRKGANGPPRPFRLPAIPRTASFRKGERG
jgi:hypothetical protein